MNILSINSDEDLQDSLKRYISENGHTLKSASLGKEALLILDEKNADVAIIDLNIPAISGVMEGIDFMKIIRRLYPETRVVIITGSEYVERAIKTMDFGIFGFLQKPLDMTKLKNTLGQIEGEILNQ